MKPGVNPQALDAKLREIDLDFQQTDWPEPIEVVRFRRSDGSEGLLSTAANPAALELQGESLDPWAQPCRRDRADHWSEQTARRAESTRVPRHRRPIWPAVVVLGLVLLTAAFWAHAAGSGWSVLNPGADTYEQVQRFGPDEFGVTCYVRKGLNSLSCVKVKGALQ
jgi:hypothetical protein